MLPSVIVVIKAKINQKVCALLQIELGRIKVSVMILAVFK